MVALPEAGGKPANPSGAAVLRCPQNDTASRGVPGVDT